MRKSLAYGDTTKPGYLVGPAGWAEPVGWRIKNDEQIPPQYEREEPKAKAS